METEHPTPERDDAILVLERIHKRYRDAAGTRREVLAGVSLAVARGGAVGLIGGSGSGKSTLARIAVRLEVGPTVVEQTLAASAHPLD